MLLFHLSSLCRYCLWAADLWPGPRKSWPDTPEVHYLAALWTAGEEEQHPGRPAVGTPWMSPAGQKNTHRFNCFSFLSLIGNVSNQMSVLWMVVFYLELSNHWGVIVSIFILAPLQFEGVAEIWQSFEFRDVLQLTVIHLKMDSHVEVSSRYKQVNQICGNYYTNKITYFEGVISFLQVGATFLLVSNWSVEFAPPINSFLFLMIFI